MKKIVKKIDRRILFLTCIFAIGLLTIFPYGAHLDQTSEQQILYSNLKVYARCFGTSNSIYKDLQGAGVVDITQSIEKDHGMAVYYPMAWIFYVNKTSPFVGNLLWHCYIYLLFFCGCAALFYLLSDIFGKSIVPAFTTLLFFLTPRMFAEGHYNNKDTILLSLVLCIAYFGWRVHQNKTWGNIVAFAFVGSLAANMKIIGAFVWGMAGIYIFLALLAKRQFHKDMLIKMMGCIALWFGFYALITPACWSGLLGFWQYLLESAQNFRWNDYVLFAGKMYNKNITGFPQIYLPVMILLTVPVGILLLAGIGLLTILPTLVKSRGKNAEGTWYILTMALSCLILLGYAVWSGTPVYNGWRHFYFVYMAVLLLTAQGISWLSDIFRHLDRQKWLCAFLSAYVLLLAGGIAMSYPHEYAYYNILAGKDVAERYELDYWDMSFKEAYEKILPKPNADNLPEERIKIGTLSNPAYIGLLAQFNAIRGKQQMWVELCGDFKEADFLIINPTYALMYTVPEYEYVKENYLLQDSITSYGNVICEIYRKK